MKKLLLLVCLLLLPAPSWAQASLLGDVQAERAKYGPSMTPTQVAAMLNQVAWNHRAEGWGLLRKGAGNSCPIRDTFVSCDILVNSQTVTHFDVLIDAENAARPQWASDGPCVLSPSSGCQMSNFLAPFDPGGGSAPTPVPPTSTGSTGGTSSGDVDALLSILADHDKSDADRDQQRSDQAERIFANLTAQLQELKALIHAIPATPAPAASVPLPAVGADKGGSNALMFLVKYIAPVVGGVIAGMQAK